MRSQADPWEPPPPPTSGSDPPDRSLQPCFQPPSECAPGTCFEVRDETGYLFFQTCSVGG